MLARRVLESEALKPVEELDGRDDPFHSNAPVSDTWVLHRPTEGQIYLGMKQGSSGQISVVSSDMC